MDLKQLSRSIVFMARRDGWRVVHRRMSLEAEGTISPYLGTITVNTKFPIKVQIAALAHEYFGHAAQWSEALEANEGRSQKAKKYARWYKDYLWDGPYSSFPLDSQRVIAQVGDEITSLLKDTVENRRMVEHCEVDASRRAVKALKELTGIEEPLGDTKRYFAELDKTALPEMRAYWFDSYLIAVEDSRESPIKQ
jgi:hypothetical protein